MADLLMLSDSEKLFLASFSAGRYCPELLFDGETLEHVRCHPMAAWKTNVRELSIAEKQIADEKTKDARESLSAIKEKYRNRL